MKKSTSFAYFIIIALTLFNKASFAEPKNIEQLFQEVISYHDSGAYLQEINETVKHAQDYVNERIAKNKTANHPQKLAVILDIDETSLSNYPYMVKRAFLYNKAQINTEILAAQGEAIKPTLAFYRYLIKNHVAVFFVTGRKEALRDATIKNLTSVGYRNWAGLYLAPDNYKNSSIIPFKSLTRAAITQQGYTIIASLGDQQSDLNGGYAEKTFKIPNPYYYLP